MEEIIRKHALINAVQFGGKARKDAVLGKILAEMPELKSKITEIMVEVERVVGEINSLSLEEQKKMMGKLELKIKKKEFKIGLPPLPNIDKYKSVVLRLAPFPSGPLHIGNARMILLNDEYARKYGGKLLLIIDDTIGSEEKPILLEAYGMIIEGLKWLGVKWQKIFYKSDRLKIYYKYAEILIRKGLAYVCECEEEVLRKNRAEGIACGHRDNSTEENLKKWKDMLRGKFKEGEAVLRLKTDIKHPNQAFRDRVLLRIVDRKHPRVGKKYRVWPLLEFSWAIDDHLLGITHILRGKELMIEDMMEKFIWEKFGWTEVEFIHYGLLRFEELKLSKTAARIAIEKGQYTGWDDPRTWSLQSLRKRGIQPEAIRNFIIQMGLSEADVTVPEEILYAENRKIIDSKANRYFAIFDPVVIKVSGPKKRNVVAHFHPDFPKRGSRKIPLDVNKIFIERDDFEKFSGREVGLMHLFTVKLDKKSKFISEKIKFEVQKIHWVSKNFIKIKLIMPDGSIKVGYGENSMRKLEKDQLVQLVRFGFCRVEKAGKETVLYFAHK